MILADTSIWVAHLRHADAHLSALIEKGQILSHPFVVGELLLGNPAQRARAAAQLVGLFEATVAQDDEVVHFIQRHSLWDRGVGYIDVHLLVATALTPYARLWSHDLKLQAAAASVGLAYAPGSA